MGNIMRKEAIGPGTIHEWHVWPLADGTLLADDRLHVYRYLDGDDSPYPDAVMRLCDDELAYTGGLMPDADEYADTPKCPECAAQLNERRKPPTIMAQARIRAAKLRTRERSCLPSSKEPRHD